MYTIEYTHKGKPVNDWDLEFQADYINTVLNMNLKSDDHRMTTRVSTENVLYQIRSDVVNDKLDFTRIQFKFEDKIIPVNQFGNCVCENHRYPKGFNDITADLCENIIMAAIQKRKKLRNV